MRSSHGETRRKKNKKRDNQRAINPSPGTGHVTRRLAPRDKHNGGFCAHAGIYLGIPCDSLGVNRSASDVGSVIGCLFTKQNAVGLTVTYVT